MGNVNRLEVNHTSTLVGIINGEPVECYHMSKQELSLASQRGQVMVQKADLYNRVRQFIDEMIGSAKRLGFELNPGVEYIKNHELDYRNFERKYG